MLQSSLLLLQLLLHFPITSTSTRLRTRLYPLKRSNSAEPPGLIPINHLNPEPDEAFVFDLHPLKQKPGEKTGIPCGVTQGMLGDLYGSHRLDLTGDPTKEPMAAATVQSTDGQDCITADPAEHGADKGSGLVWLLGDPAEVPAVDDAPPLPENPAVVKALTPA